MREVVKNRDVYDQGKKKPKQMEQNYKWAGAQVKTKSSVFLPLLIITLAASPAVMSCEWSLERVLPCQAVYSPSHLLLPAVMSHQDFCLGAKQIKDPFESPGEVKCIHL